MAKKSNYQEWAECPIRFTAGIIGDRWSLLILRDIMFKGHRHYRDFLNSGEGISTNILADRLKALETRGVLRKIPDPGHGARALYLLDEMGFDLIPAILNFIVWAAKYDQFTAVPKEFAETIAANPQQETIRLIDGIRRRDKSLLSDVQA